MTNAAFEREQFARAARIDKRDRLWSKLDRVYTARDANALADRLASFTQHERDVFAAGHGVRSPSPETWSDLVAVTRSRVSRRAS